MSDDFKTSGYISMREINDFIDEFKNENSNNILSLVQFDHEIENIHTIMSLIRTI